MPLPVCLPMPGFYDRYRTCKNQTNMHNKTKEMIVCCAAGCCCCKYKYKRRSQPFEQIGSEILPHIINPAGPKNLVFPSFARATSLVCRHHMRAGGAYLPRGNNLPHGRHHRGPRAHVRDRTADTTAAALPAVETSPTGLESAGRPSRTAAVAPPPTFVRRFFWWS